MKFSVFLTTLLKGKPADLRFRYLFSSIQGFPESLGLNFLRYLPIRRDEVNKQKLARTGKTRITPKARGISCSDSHPPLTLFIRSFLLRYSRILCCWAEQLRRSTQCLELGAASPPNTQRGREYDSPGTDGLSASQIA